MADSETEATVYARLRRRSILLAWLWASSECCRLVFASTTLLSPWVILVFTVFEAAKQSIGHVFRLLGEWRLYAFILTASAISFVLWRLAERGSQKLLQFLGDEPASQGAVPGGSP